MARILRPLHHAVYRVLVKIKFVGRVVLPPKTMHQNLNLKSRGHFELYPDSHSDRTTH